MGTNKRLNRDQKRRKKLAERSKTQEDGAITAYSGDRYRKPIWVQHVFRTELGVYETILQSERRLSNDQVDRVFRRLIVHLKAGAPGPLDEFAPDCEYIWEQVEEYLFWNIRRNWGILFDDHGFVASEHLIGILRTLLYSIEAHEWSSGPALGYVHFLHGFMKRVPMQSFSRDPVLHIAEVDGISAVFV